MATDVFRDKDWEDKYRAWKTKKEAERGRRYTYKPLPEKSFRDMVRKEEKAMEQAIVKDLVKTEHFIEEENKAHPLVTKMLIALAFIIPLAILGYALYINFLPFGYHNEYILTVDENGTVSPISSEIYLTNTQGRRLLSLPNGVQGQVNLVIEPKVVLKNATVNISLVGDGLSLGTPIDFDPNNYTWDYDWDFTKGVPSQLNGTAQYREDLNCTYFDAVKEQTLSLPNSQDLFESGPFTVYVRWKPSEISKELGNSQQIIGHYNWELWQNENNIQFRIGRVNDANGTFYSIFYPINADFFDDLHEILAIYSPDSLGNGYFELYIDNNFGGRLFIMNDTIFADYNSNNPLSFGWSPHNYGQNSYFDGCLYKTDIKNKETLFNTNQEAVILVNSDEINIHIMGNGNLTKIKTVINE